MNAIENNTRNVINSHYDKDVSNKGNDKGNDGGKGGDDSKGNSKDNWNSDKVGKGDAVKLILPPPTITRLPSEVTLPLEAIFLHLPFLSPVAAFPRLSLSSSSTDDDISRLLL
ncbi:hypothetical protein RCL_jg21427.t1 [Rhizophagus clarus]|uniref:Uncharacterized protein n=1 Tax=Rhizophagus clarus TaxID=94130 RepID=A0A8H3LWN4_9GLOM|nr:hypothetical protein RCL_jg21427.t1 [Rhizophagus clarus]